MPRIDLCKLKETVERNEAMRKTIRSAKRRTIKEGETKGLSDQDYPICSENTRRREEYMDNRIKKGIAAGNSSV